MAATLLGSTRSPQSTSRIVLLMVALMEAAWSMSASPVRSMAKVGRFTNASCVAAISGSTGTSGLITNWMVPASLMCCTPSDRVPSSLVTTSIDTAASPS